MIFGAKLLVFLLVAGCILYWIRFAPVKVQAYKVAKGTLVNEVMGTGTLEARTRCSISPEVSGMLAQVLADQNDKVSRGQLLAQLDDGNLRRQVEVAKAEQAVAKATVERIEAEILSANASAVKMRSNFERISVLEKSHAVAENELEKALESMEVAEANLNRAKLTKVEAELTVAKTEASLRYWQERLADTRLCAPFDGLVVCRNRDPGDVVVPGSSVLDIISTEQLWISAWVDETAMDLLAVGQPVRIVFRSSPGTSLTGMVVRLAPKTDSETREFLVDVGVDQLPKNWAVGQRAEVYIETGRKNDVIPLPQRFIVWKEEKSFVMIDDAGKARLRKVSIGLKGRENVEISDGLTEGRIVIGVAPGTELPRDGRAVKHDKL